MTIKIPNDVVSLMQKLNDAGYEAYVVGGAVRDSILGISPKDWDLTTNAKPDEIEEVFKDFLVIETGIKHGTVTVVLNNENYEITTYRIDGDYSDGRHPDSVKFTDSLKEDLSRRDLTINALAADIDGEIVDYFNGLDDIKNKIIRTVGNPYERFSEDALRIFRVFRFATKYKSNISAKTIEAINKFVFDSTTLHKISSERISAEFRKIIENYDYSSFNNIIAMLEIMYNFIIKADDTSNYGLSKNAIDFFKLIERKIIDNAYVAYISIGPSASFSAKIAALFADSIERTYDGIRFSTYPDTKNGFCISFNNFHLAYPKKSVDELLRNFFKFTSKEVKEIETILDTIIIARETEKLDYIAVKKIMSDIKSKKYDVDIFYYALKICEADHEISYKCSIARAFYDIVLAKNEPLTISDLAIDGNDVIRITQCSGKDVGKNLSLCLNNVLASPEKNTKEELTKILLSAKEEN